MEAEQPASPGSPQTDLSVDPAAIAKRATGWFSLLGAFHFFLEFMGLEMPSITLLQIIIFRFCVFQALQFSKTLISSWLLCSQSNPKSELWVLESRPLSEGSSPLVAGLPILSIFLMIHWDGCGEGQG